MKRNKREWGRWFILVTDGSSYWFTLGHGHYFKVEDEIERLRQLDAAIRNAAKMMNEFGNGMYVVVEDTTT